MSDILPCELCGNKPYEAFKVGVQKNIDDMMAEHQKLFHANSSMSVKIEAMRGVLAFCESIEPKPSVTRDGPMTDASMMAHRIAAKIRTALRWKEVV